MKAAYMDSINSMKFREEEIPVPKENQVLVRIEYCGICGSDVHYYEKGRIGDFVVKGDFVLGHEVAGTVVKLGEKVTFLKIGDKVALEPGYTCGKCEFCKTGRYNLCPDVIFFATPPVQGALQEYVAHPADMCFKLPDKVSTKEGALVEPLAVGLYAVKQGQVRLGDSVIILGSGCIGLTTLLAAKASGAAQIVVADLYQKRLDLAKKLGATYTINVRTENIEKKIAEIFSSQGADIVFETAGAASTIKETPFFAKRGGTIVLVGLATQSEIDYNFSQIMQKELTIKSVFRYCNLYPAAIAAIASGAIDIKQIVTQEFAFEDAKLALDTVVKQAQDVVKCVIKL
jgi:L-iditol 2-dehydrogenase